MGKRDIGSNETEATGTNPTGGSDGNSVTTRTKRGGTGGGTTTENKSTQKDVGLSNVAKKPKAIPIDVPSNKEEKPEQKKTGRGRPKGTTSSKKKSSTKSKGAQVTANQTAILLMTVSGIMASKPQLAPFALTMEEANQIAEPLTNILAKNDTVSELTGEYADHIALVFAVFTIMLPKFLLFKAQQPKKEDKKVEQKREVTTNNRRTDSANGNTNNTKNDGFTFNGSINELISPIGGF